MASTSTPASVNAERTHPSDVRADDRHDHIASAEEAVGARRTVDHGVVSTDVVRFLKHRVGLEAVVTATVSGGSQEFRADQVLVALGRRPVTEGLNLPCRERPGWALRG